MALLLALGKQQAGGMLGCRSAMLCRQPAMAAMLTRGIADTPVTHPDGLTHRITTYFMPQVRACLERTDTQKDRGGQGVLEGCM